MEAIPGAEKTMDQNAFRRELAQQLRVDAVRASDASGSGHPTSSMSAADLIAVLLDGHLRYDFERPEYRGNDRLIFSKGHASPLLYAAYKAAGAIDDAELLSFRKLGSRLEGHPAPSLPWVDVATGSLGQGLPIGVGMALAGKRLDRLPYRVWVLCGDSELAEGSMWEAFEHAGHERLDNLVAILDINRLGQRGPTRHEWDLDAYAVRARAFGWQAIVIDGHDAEAIEHAYAQAEQASGRPTAIVAKTRKGRGVRAVEDLEGFHGKPVKDAAEAVEELGGVRDMHVEVREPDQGARPHRFAPEQIDPPRYELGGEVPTRQAYGEALAALGAVRPDVVALDGEVADSTHAYRFAEAHPERFFEMYIAEQLMLGAAVGMQALGWTPYVATFAAFLSRAYDFVRMAAVSRANLRLCGSHAGVAIGQDGPSQMGLEDLAAFRAVHSSTVLYPCDANQTRQLVEAMADVEGISYLRTSRGATPVIYRPDKEFVPGGSSTLRSSEHDEVTLVAAGVTVHEALRAADALAEEGVSARVIDLYSIKPVDSATLVAAASDTGAIVTVEDHWPEGGLGDAVLAALAEADASARVRKLAVRTLVGSGTPAELLREAGIDAHAITEAAHALARVAVTEEG
jgi:transketolase